MFPLGGMGANFAALGSDLHQIAQKLAYNHAAYMKRDNIRNCVIMHLT